MTLTNIRPDLSEADGSWSAVPPRLLVTGSRDWSDERSVRNALFTAYGWLGVRGLLLVGRPTAVTLVHGNANGLDRIAGGIAAEWHWDVEVHPALWQVHGKSAGPIRNSEMVLAGANLCLAFPLPRPGGGKSGTQDCYEKALDAGIPTWIFPARRMGQ